MGRLFAIALALGVAWPVAAEEEPPAPQTQRQRKKRMKRPRRGGRTSHLGRNCRHRSDCAHRAQVCLKQQDVTGKETARGFCALPCKPIDEGIKKGEERIEATKENVAKTRTRPPPRCPKRFDCRSAGGGVPIDLCVRQ